MAEPLLISDAITCVVLRKQTMRVEVPIVHGRALRVVQHPVSEDGHLLERARVVQHERDDVAEDVDLLLLRHVILGVDVRVGD